MKLMADMTQEEIEDTELDKRLWFEAWKQMKKNNHRQIVAWLEVQDPMFREDMRNRLNIMRANRMNMKYGGANAQETQENPKT